MRLRTYEAFWVLKNGLLHSYPSLRENIETEILVVGAGITGALTSHALMEAGYRVTLVDRRDVGQGSTSATTSMLQYEIDEQLQDLAEMIGEDAAVTCYKAGIEAIKNLEKLVKETGIDCGFEPKKSLYISHSKKAAENLKKEFEIRNKHKLGVSWLEADEVKRTYGLKCFGAILSETAASVDAYKMAHELIAFNVKRGMVVYDQTQPDKYNLDDEQPNIITDCGCKISFKTVVFCNGFESTDMLKEDIAKLFYTYASVSERDIDIPEALRHTLVWDTNDPYIYMRTTDDNRLLIGGEDSSNNISFFQQKRKETKAEKLQETLKDILPEVDFINDFDWAGTFGTSKDGLPYIGKSPEYENALFVLGFGGNGITFSAQAMQIIPDLLQGKPNELAEYYRFGR